MPLKLNVGLSRKVGEPDFGSRGASVNLEIEIDSGAVGEPERLQQTIRRLFGLAKQSITEELQGHHAVPGSNNGHNPLTNGHAQANGSHRRSANRFATPAQVKAIRTIASRQGIDLADELHTRFGVDHPQDLTLAQASQLIDGLKSQSSGQLVDLG